MTQWNSLHLLSYEKIYSCPTCKGSKTQRRGVRQGKIKYFCTSCHKWFQINRVRNAINVKRLTLQHIDGVSFRSLSDYYSISVGKAYGLVSEYLSSLPHIADVTRKYCSRYSGILEVDGKYVSVKGD